MKPLEAQFELFWKEYPRRVAKAHARKMFFRLNPNDELFAKIIEAIKAQKKIWDDPQYIPYPGSWLNGERWEDEIPVAVSHRPESISLEEATKSYIPDQSDWNKRYTEKYGKKS